MPVTFQPLGARVVLLAVLLLTGCTVQDRQKMAFTQKLKHIDDPETGVRCYYITGLNSVDCVQVKR